MCDNSITSAKTLGKETKKFFITTGRYQGLTLNLYMFTFAMDKLTSHI